MGWNSIPGASWDKAPENTRDRIPEQSSTPAVGAQETKVSASGAADQIAASNTAASWQSALNTAKSYADQAMSTKAAKLMHLDTVKDILTGGETSAYNAAMGAAVPKLNVQSPEAVNQSAANGLLFSDKSPIPYGDMKKIQEKLGEGEYDKLIKSVDIDDVAMQISHTPSKANFKILDYDSGVIEQVYADFVLTNMSYEIQQRFQVLETFDPSYIYLFGEQPIFAQFTLMFYDMDNKNWYRTFLDKFRTVLGGYQAASQRKITYLLADHFLFEGVMLKLNTIKDTNNGSRTIGASLAMYLTGLTNLTEEEKARSQQSQAQAPLSPAETAKYQNAMMTAAINTAGGAPFLGGLAQTSVQSAMASAQHPKLDSGKPSEYVKSLFVESGGSYNTFAAVTQGYSVPLTKEIGKQAYASTNIGPRKTGSETV